MYAYVCCAHAYVYMCVCMYMHTSAYAETHCTIFTHIYKCSSQHSWSKYWRKIDYVIIHTEDHKDVHLTRVMTNVDDYRTEHRFNTTESVELVRSKMAIQLALKRRLQQKRCQREINHKSLWDPAKAELPLHLRDDKLSSTILGRWGTVESSQHTLKAISSAACQMSLGLITRKSEDFFGKEHYPYQNLRYRGRERETDIQREAFHS